MAKCHNLGVAYSDPFQYKTKYILIKSDDWLKSCGITCGYFICPGLGEVGIKLRGVELRRGQRMGYKVEQTHTLAPKTLAS